MEYLRPRSAICVPHITKGKKKRKKSGNKPQIYYREHCVFVPFISWKNNTSPKSNIQHSKYFSKCSEAL